ncbi:MAG: SEC-C domain-containing protein [Spirochaetota bacterium]
MKTGRNEPCPCGSGLKYKKCHGSPNMKNKIFNSTINQINQEIIKQKVREDKLGDVRPTISTEFKGRKIVAVGNQIHYAPRERWKTFHDFLFDYIKHCFGIEWANKELKKKYEEMHSILQWYQDLCKFQQAHMVEKHEIYSADSTGSVGAYLALAYDLYILRHHLALQERLITRLKDKKQFQGARYEVYVTSSFIKAGFDISFEDETDRTISHCEFVATHKASGNKYSVEAKSRHRKGLLGQDGEQRNWDDQKLWIGTLLRDALKKSASYPRIIFIDVNMPPEKGEVFKKSWVDGLMKEVSRVEVDIISGVPCPPAYLYFTNHPNHYVGNNEVEPAKDFFFTAINIQEFKQGSIENARKTHLHQFILWDSINSHCKIPESFENS